MSLDFKLHYDRLRENDPTKLSDPSDASQQPAFYDGASNARNLCLVWPDGKQQFVSYSYLVGGSFTPNEELNEITLNFTSYNLIIKGFALGEMFTALLDQLLKRLPVTDRRYLPNENAQQPVVVEAVFEKIN